MEAGVRGEPADRAEGALRHAVRSVCGQQERTVDLGVQLVEEVAGDGARIDWRGTGRRNADRVKWPSSKWV